MSLSGTQASGVPVHPAAGNAAFVRWPNGTVGNVTAIDPQTQWRRVEANGLSGWVVRTYLTVLVGEADAANVNELPTYLVGTWNLEWLSDSKSRGFPENTRGGLTYGARVNDDYRQIAEVIRDRLGARIMVLSEINGATATQSNELDRLVGHLGTGWAYFLSTSGAQRLAILYDTRAARRDRCVELTFPARSVQGKEIFDRDPLACAFTFLDGSVARNDLLVVAVHLASGQQLNVNHDTAMAVLTRRLEQETSNGVLGGPERDVLIAGDFNASRYDNYIETFWSGLSPTRFQLRTLSPDDGDEYGGTRLAGVPLSPRSQIDYMMASSQNGGLLSKLAGPFGQVRLDLLGSDYNVFREHLSDHIPVTIRVRVMPDDDPQ